MSRAAISTATVTPLRPQQKTIPGELKARPQWVVWRSEERDGKLTKVPYYTPTRKASATDPQTWLSFEDAWRLYESARFDGIGYVFGA